ncbi:hypothetical protein [Rhodococcus marinonascens]|uniref:hypothetical protein n=1 Tax=Rhodococcus marinonascens TaxID=38311 RepID=UPI000AA0C154|nr:hypothetical protein [Rhodococcus marinonascens]
MSTRPRLGDSVGAASAPFGTELWFTLAASMVLFAIAIVLRFGARMARDQEGLI